MANPFAIEPANPLQALMMGVQGFDTAAKRTKEAELRAAYQDVGSQLSSGGELTTSALGKLMGLGPEAAPMVTAAAAFKKATEGATDDIKEYNFAKQQGFTGSLADWIQRKRAGAGEYGLNPVWTVGPDGKPAMFQLGKGGQPIQTQFPSGYQPTRDQNKVNLGTAWGIMDPTTGEIRTVVPKDLAGAERAKEIGQAGGKAESSLPTAIANAEAALQSIEATKTHPGRGWATGWAGLLPGIPNTDQLGFINHIEQLKGKTFLQAFDFLRGAGAITEQEGIKATQALARLDRRQSEKDFNAALKDLEGIVRKGLAVARQKAQMGTTPGLQPQVPAPQSDVRVGPPLNQGKDQGRVPARATATPSAEFQNGTRARNPQTGEIIEYRDGQWYRAE